MLKNEMQIKIVKVNCVKLNVFYLLQGNGILQVC